MVLSDEQRARLLRAQLGALVRGLTGADLEAVSVGVNAAASDEAKAFVLSNTADAATLAGSIAWALRQGASTLTLFTDDLAGDVARMAGYFSVPVEVRSVQGAGSVSVEASPLPEHVATPRSAETDRLSAQLRDAGLEVVVEDGVIRGEVQGLEVARLVLWPVESGGDGALHLEAGVGRFDRDAVAAMHQGEEPTVTLARSVAMVRAERVAGSSTHPLTRMARERWLRRSLVEDPGRVGARSLEPIGTTVRSESVRDVTPAAALGADHDGEPVVVVCSVGADLSFVPVAADTREWQSPSARLVLVVAERDRLATLDRLAGLLREPAEVRTVTAPWDVPS